jgi:hypothetical protein
MSENQDKTEDFTISKEILDKLKEAGLKEGLKINELILSLLENRNREGNNDSKKEQSRTGGTTGSTNPQDQRSVQVIADLSKLIPPNSSDIIELLRRITQSLENIEREHAQGWSDQRIDLQALSKRLDKLL